MQYKFKVHWWRKIFACFDVRILRNPIFQFTHFQHYIENIILSCLIGLTYTRVDTGVGTDTITILVNEYGLMKLSIPTVSKYCAYSVRYSAERLHFLV